MAERKIQLLLEEMNKKCKTQDAAYMNIYAIKQICEIVYILGNRMLYETGKVRSDKFGKFSAF